MASLREIRRKIKSVKSTQQITKAMKMVAAARLRKAQMRITTARPFAQKIDELMTDLLTKIEQDDTHPLFLKRTSTKKLLVIVTSDKGLCGAFNTTLFRKALLYFKEHGGMANVDIVVIGRKGRDYFKRLSVTLVKDYVNVLNNVTFVQADVITQDLVQIYLENPQYQTVDLLYNEFKSVIRQTIVLRTLLPLTPVQTTSTAQKTDFIYEPEKKQLLVALISRHLKAQVYRVLLESAAAELGARMSAMSNATTNASELLNLLTLKMNRTRQASITNEILEVVSGAEALK